MILQNSNIFKIKRKLAGALSFGIIEKYKDFFSISKDYYPSYASLRELSALIIKKNNQDGEKDKSINKLDKMIKDVECKANIDSYNSCL